MRRPVTALVAGATLALAAAACASDGSGGGGGGGGISRDEALVPDSTLPPPGSCDPLDQQIPPPDVLVDGTTTEATFGVGAYQCGTITGNGYIVNNFNPVLIDIASQAAVTVRINSDAVTEIATINGLVFAQDGDRSWVSSAPVGGCDRITISLRSPSGQSNAVYGVDIRVGGEATQCPQRDLEVEDPGAVASAPLPPASFDTVVAPNITYEPDFSVPPIPVTIPPDTTG